MLNWHQVWTHEDLIAIWILQLKWREPELWESYELVLKSRQRAIDGLEKRLGGWFDLHEYEEGMYVWLRESQLDEVKGGKGLPTYSGPYVIHEKRETGLYVLRELNGVILPGHVNPQRLHLFYYRPDNQTLRANIPARSNGKPIAVKPVSWDVNYAF
ncbi:hypothetical protein K435DRAFT_688319 [Dendrothele bispora CBS 962.96]|uniref:Uncharacterized protein n=1 Tax=Dendrothele bispora (strain CBS 962.96) TaxID=1314807 RepID=A0A4S8L625_DENBC|nr:hypothetical protein K435DRAFT_688319 [Dendrothele bispora CBS 962.96]